MTAKHKKVWDAVIKARTILLVGQPFYGCLALHLELVEENDEKVCDTMMVDGVKMWYYPPFVQTLSEQELIGVVAHEVSHCAYKHMTRRGDRHPVLWNWAGDFVINADILKAGFSLPGKPIFVAMMKNPTGVKGHLLDTQFDNMGTEEVYERLLQQFPVTKIQIMIQGGQGQGQGNGNQDGQGQGQGDNAGEGDGQGKSLPQGADWGGCGGVIDAGNGPGAKAQAGIVSREWETIVRQAVAVAKRANAGTVPGHLQRLVEDLQKPKVNWKDLTRMFIDGNMSCDYSWSQPNRRFIGQGLYLPGHIPDSLRHMVFLGDVSGSITENIMKGYLSEVQSVLDDGVAEHVTTAYFDTDIRQVDEFDRGDLIRCKTVGGGGTDFRPMFEWLPKACPDASCVIVLTDMLPCSWDLKDPGIPVLWAAYLPESHLKDITPPFGSVIHVDSGD